MIVVHVGEPLGGLVREFVNFILKTLLLLKFQKWTPLYAFHGHSLYLNLVRYVCDGFSASSS